MDSPQQKDCPFTQRVFNLSIMQQVDIALAHGEQSKSGMIMNVVDSNRTAYLSVLCLVGIIAESEFGSHIHILTYE